LNLNGSQQLTFAPVAQETTVSLSSEWPDPSFTGAFLPTDRKIEPNGFTARWQVPHLARSVPQAWSLADQDIERLTSYVFGVRFFVPVDFYQLVSRASKYAMMFVATAFMAVFLLELRSSRQVHAVQYFFVGLTIIFFYVLLLSLAEQIGFLAAYLIASVATGGMLSLYVAKVQHSVVKGLVMGGIFFALYGLLYMILQLEDYALLAGAVAGFVMLAVVMFSTLNVDWSGKTRTAS
jgi:inner membrane protein